VKLVLRDYQQRSLDELYQWWVEHPLASEIPVCVLPTAAGKSVIIAELARLLFDTYPESHPRTVVIVPSKELAEQNAEKLRSRLPPHITVGYYSASLGRKNATADVIVATIGSIYQDAHLLGKISCVVIDEAHLVSQVGAEAGRYRQFLTTLSKLCAYRVVGYTATPFRGDWVWLTDGANPLFTGIACTVKIRELLDLNYLSPLVVPSEKINTRIDTNDVRTTSGDYNLKDLEARVNEYLPRVVIEATRLAEDRKKWIAFCATVANAETLVALLNEQGVTAVLVCGETPKRERIDSIAAFRSGKIRCLVTVLALATGFDVPDVDCILWCRPTQSPVLYVQGAGRGMRIAPGKIDCLWLDFSDTTERMGPVDTIKGRNKKKRKTDEESVAPTKVCNECGDRSPISAMECIHCGAPFPEREEVSARSASTAAILQSSFVSKVVTVPVSNVMYQIHKKLGSPDSLRVDYYNGLTRVASDWLCFDHQGFARAKAHKWFHTNKPSNFHSSPDSTKQIKEWLDGGFAMNKPASLVIDNAGKYPVIMKYLS
jgi:DNA repair protein RadD